MPKSWDDTSEKQLLLSVIHALNVTKVDWNSVAEMMGEGCTASAVSQKFAKIRKACTAQYGEADGSAGTPAATPKSAAGGKRGRPKKAAGEGSTKGKGKKVDSPVEDDDDVEESPTKRLKKEESVGEGEHGDGELV